MTESTRIKYVPSKGEGESGSEGENRKGGELQIFDNAKMVHRVPVSGSFDPTTMFLKRHCCDLDLVSNCVETPDGHCAGGKIEVWM